MNKIEFNTVLNEMGDPIGYDVTGTVTTDGEQAHIGYSCFYFERAFNELCYWVKECPGIEIVYTTSELKVTA